jgi:hypothetical protein
MGANFCSPCERPEAARGGTPVGSLGPELARRRQDSVLTRGAIDPSAPLLVNGSGRRWSRTWLSDTIARIAELAELRRLRPSAHKLRHTSNVISRVAGIDPLTRSKMLTHSDPRAQARYDHLPPMRSMRPDSASRARSSGILGSRRMTSYFGQSLLSVPPRSHRWLQMTAL